jgi:hypothetical protein
VNLAALGAGLAAAIIVLSATPALAVDGPIPGVTGEAGDSEVILRGGTDQAGSGAAPRSSGPYRVYSFLPACQGNDPNSADSRDAGCAGQQAMCARTSPGTLMYWRFSAVRSPDGALSPWSPAGSVCLRRDQVPAAAVPAFTAADLRRLPLPASTVRVQPADRPALVQVPTNLYATDRPATFRVTLLGTPVLVRATPVAWSWSYGDGDRATFTVRGGPYPDLTTAHTYTRPGTFPVTLTTTWTGTYAVSGGPPVPIDGTATVTTPPTTVTAVATRAELVAAPLP